MTSTLHQLHLSSNVHISYLDEGKSKTNTLLFIHGLANYAQVWLWNIVDLQKNARCIAIDLPGNGMSSRGNYKYDANFYCQVILEFMDALSLKNVTLVGHSMGGQIACKLAMAQPKRFNKLVLCAPSGFEYYNPHEVVLSKSFMQMGNIFSIDESALGQSIRSSFYKVSPMSKKITQDLLQIMEKNDRRFYRTMVEKSMAMMLDEPIFNQLNQIKQPILVFFGERDEMIPNRFFHQQTTRDIAIEACNKLTTCRLVTYPETGHFVQIERALEVNQEIEIFIKS